MLPTLTDGKTTLEPDLFELVPPLTAGSDSDEPRLEAELLFGPLRQRLPPGKGVLWWGHFSLADQARLTVYACRGAQLHLRILDLEYRVLEEQRTSRCPERLVSRVERSGLVFFHVANEGERDELVFLQVARRQPGPFGSTRRPGAREWRWLRSIERWLGLGINSGEGLEPGLAR